jgi:hypothetical protein
MQVPGTETRQTEDRDCVIKCECGATLTTLRPGQQLALRKPGRTAEYACKCGKRTKVNLSEVARG